MPRKEVSARTPLRRLIFLFFLSTLFLPAAEAPARNGQGTAGLPMIASVHKHRPSTGSRGNPPPASSASGGTTVLSGTEAKCRPDTMVATGLSRHLSSRSAIVMDADSGEILYALHPDRPGQPASTIKVLTSILAMDHLHNTELIPVSRRAAGMPRSKIYLRTDKYYPANDLINAVLLDSANDASVALAEKIAGSERAFAGMMTEKAKALGARNTICKTASGLTARGQQTTVRDLATIFNKAMRNREFARRVKRIRTRTSYGRMLRNHNKALWRITGAEGGKTGYTRAARQTYVGKFNRHGREIIVAIMGSRTMWGDIRRLVDYGFAGQPAVRTANKSAQPRGAAEKRGIRVLSDNKKLARL